VRSRGPGGGAEINGTYANSNWTERYGNAYIAEAIGWSENGNHATIYTVGLTAEEAAAKLIGALRELKLIPEACMKDEQW
jgi:hypothetical protein